MARGAGVGGYGMRWVGPDKSKLKGHKIDWTLLREVAKLARPYWKNVIVFAVATIGNSALVAVPPLLFRSVIDKAIPDRDLHELATLSLLAIGVIVTRG